MICNESEEISKFLDPPVVRMWVFKILCIYDLSSFTGGDTGVAISKKAGMVPLQMELGGKDACIVIEDADLDLVGANIIKGGFSYR